MKDSFDYNPPESVHDCCAGISRHGRLTQQAKAEVPRPKHIRRKNADPAPTKPLTAPRE